MISIGSCDEKERFEISVWTRSISAEFAPQEECKCCTESNEVEGVTRELLLFAEHSGFEWASPRNSKHSDWIGGSIRENGCILSTQTIRLNRLIQNFKLPFDIL